MIINENEFERWFWAQWMVGNDFSESIWCKNGLRRWVLEWEWERKETVLKRERNPVCRMRWGRWTIFKGTNPTYRMAITGLPVMVLWIPTWIRLTVSKEQADRLWFGEERLRNDLLIFLTGYPDCGPRVTFKKTACRFSIAGYPNLIQWGTIRKTAYRLITSGIPVDYKWYTG